MLNLPISHVCLTPVIWLPLSVTHYDMCKEINKKQLFQYLNSADRSTQLLCPDQLSQHAFILHALTVPSFDLFDFSDAIM